MTAYSVSGARGLPLDADSPFDRQAAADSMFESAGWPDNPNPTKAKRGFVVIESDGDPKLKGSYHLPFARVVDGTLKAVPNGVRNAKSRLPQLGGVSQEVVDRGNALLDSYMERIHEETDGGDGGGKSIIVARRQATLWSPAQVFHRAQTGLADDELVQRMHDRAPDPSVFEQFPPYLFSAVISSNAVDTFYTQMQPSSLRNYADDATEGVDFQQGHMAEVGFGQSLNGRYIGGQGDGKSRTVADFYTAQGMTLGGVNTSDFVNAVRAGLRRDVSIGFYSGEVRCSICGGRMVMDIRSLFAPDEEQCWHIPGVEYALTDGAESKKARAKAAGERRTAIGLVENARLAHVADVGAGSCPNAVIVKAQTMADAGRLEPAVARSLENRYHVRLIGADHVYAPGPPPVVATAATIDRKQTTDPASVPEPTSQTKEARMGDLTISEQVFAQLRALVPDAQAGDDDPSAVVTALLTRHRELASQAADRATFEKELGELRPLRDRVKELEPLAETGRKARSRLLDSVLTEGVRAFGGEKFNPETRRAALASLSDEDLEGLRDTYAELARERLPGGRLTDDSRPEQFGGTAGGQSPNGRATSTPVYRD